MVPVALRFLSLVLLAAQTGTAVPDAVAEAARGTALAREGKYDLAIEHYKAALRLNRDLPGLQLNLGLAYLKSDHLREASAAFEEAVRADSASFQARALLGMSYYGSSRYREAAAQLQRASEAQPDNLELRYTLAQSYLWSEQYPEALREFQFLLSKDPDSGPVHILLGQVLDASHREEAATAEFEAAVKASTVPPRRSLRAGLSLLEQRRYEEACREFEVELETQPQQRKPWLTSETRKCARTGISRPRRTSDARWPWMRISASRTWILASFSLEGANPAKPHAVSARRFGLTLPSRMPITVWAGYGVHWAVEQEAQAEFEKVKKLAEEEPAPPLVRLSGRPLP